MKEGHSVRTRLQAPAAPDPKTVRFAEALERVLAAAPPPGSVPVEEF